MIEFNRYFEEISVSTEPTGPKKLLGKEYLAYRMDGSDSRSHMRKDAGLGQCFCCDYFVSNKHSIFLIEETRLMEKVKELNRKYDYLQDTRRKEFVDKSILQRYQLKVYGSMLVLCRLAAQYKNAEDFLQNKNYNFWLVVSGMTEEEDTRLFDDLRSYLFSELRGHFTKEVMNAVEIIPSYTLAEKLSQYNLVASNSGSNL